MTTKIAGYTVLRLRWFGAVVLVMSVFPALVHAALPDGINYLATQQNTDGSYANATNLVDNFQSTAETLLAFQTLGQTTSPGIPSALAFIHARVGDNVRYLARGTVVNAQAGNNVTGFVSTLLTYQNTDGGFGIQPFHENTILDTAFALDALTLAGVSDANVIAPAVGFLLSRQQASGGWADGDNLPSVYLTAISLRALWYYRHVYVGVPQALTNGKTFLFSQRDGAGLWGEHFNTALALLAVIPTLPDLSSVTTSITALQAAQLANGSWDNDAYTTALALQALYLASLPQPNPDFVRIQGNVVDALTGSPLSGVSVALSGAATASVVTASDGLFLFKDLPAGNYSLQLTLANYATVSATTTAALGQTVDFGVLLMTKGAGGTTGTVQGAVTDAATGAPLAGVSVTATGVATPALTDAAGRYQIPNVAAGTITVTAILAGYSPASATGTLSVGGILNFSPALTIDSALESTLKGTVTAAATGLPLPGVSISVTGSTTAQASTGAQGNYEIALLPGVFTVTASLSGYDTVTASATVALGQIVRFSPKLYTQGASPPDANTTTISGVVLDAGTNQPLASVAITATYGTATKNLVSNAQGQFSLTGITTSQLHLAFSLAGYVSSTIDVALEPLETFDMGQVRLRKEKATQLLPDLTVTAVSRTAAPTDPNTLIVSGTLSADVANIGTATAPAGITTLAFYDVNKNNLFDTGDVILGSATTSIEIAVNATVPLAIPVQGALPFRDAPIHVFIDSVQSVVELKETNNVNSTASLCEIKPNIGTFKPVLKWHWSGSAILPTYNQVMMAPVVAQTNDDNGDGKIDQNDIPDVIFVAYPGIGTYGGGVLRIVSGNNGQEIVTVADLNYRLTSWSHLAVGDIDNDGLVEIVGVRFGGGLVAFNHDGSIKWVVPGSYFRSGWSIGGPSIADIDGDGKPEIIYEKTVVNGDGTVRWVGSGSFIGDNHPYQDVPSAYSIVADIDLDGRPEIIAGASAYSADGKLLWQRSDIGDGFTAVGNFNADPYPEIVLVSNNRVYMLDHLGSVIWGPVLLPGNRWGGAPTIADMDGDGTPEIGVASGSAYTVFKADGSVLWSKPITDASSGMTGSSVFDFDGDGQAEVVNADEYTLRVYKGSTGEVVFSTPNSSGTAYELPVVADIDNDNHADIIVASNRYYGNYPGSTVGVRVFQDQNNSWVNTRKIWNQHSYHINNINDDGSIPQVEINSWQTHNTYRLNAVPDPTGVPDLTASLLKLIDNGTGQPLSLSLRVGNGGAVPSPNGVVTSFYQGDPAAGGVLLGNVTLSVIVPGDYQDIRLDNVILPNTADLYAVVDSTNKASECVETNNKAQIPLAVSAVRGTIGVATDSPVYGPNAPAVLSATVTNTGALTASFTAQLLVEDAGGAVVVSFPARAVGSVAGGSTVNLTEPWNTGTTLTGNYRLRGRLYDLNATLLNEATAAFTIGAVAGPSVSLRVTTDRPVYHTTDLVAIQNLIANLTTNVIVNNATLRLTIRDPANAVFFTKDGPLGQLVPGALLDIGLSVPLSAAPLGLYRIEGKVLDATGAVLATGGTGFEVRVDLSKSLTGKVMVGLPTVERGNPQTCTDTLTNVGSQPIANLEVHRVLVNLDTQVSHDDRTVILTLAVGQVNTDTRTLATTGLLPGNHACVLQARIDGVLKTLAYAPFVVTVPPIKVDATLSLGSKGRVLVLLDSGLAPPPAKVSDSDPHGPSGAPLLSAQRAFLEKLLKDNDWSYTITTTADDFTRELHTGTYNLYAVFAEQEKLAETAQKELREAIFRGEGLLMAGIHDARHLVVHDALGIKLIGQVTQAVSGLLTTSPLGLTGSITLIPGDKTLRIKRLTAQSAGVYLLGNPPPPQGPIEPDCRAVGQPGGPDECDGQPNNYLDAFTLNGYGLGKAFFAGFDLLAQATLDGNTGVAAQTLLASLAYANPTPPRLTSGGVVPVSLALQNKGISTTVTAVLTLPTGVSVVDLGTGTLTSPTTVRWDVPLAVDEAKTVTVWVRLPTTAGVITFNATVHTQAAPIVLLADPSTTLTVLPPTELATSLTTVEALIAQNHPEAKTLKQVSTFLTNALKAPTPEHAVFEVLKATDALLGFTDPALTALRAALGEWVREAGMRGY